MYLLPCKSLNWLPYPLRHCCTRDHPPFTNLQLNSSTQFSSSVFGDLVWRICGLTKSTTYRMCCLFLKLTSHNPGIPIGPPMTLNSICNLLCFLHLCKYQIHDPQYTKMQNWVELFCWTGLLQTTMTTPYVMSCLAKCHQCWCQCQWWETFIEFLMQIAEFHLIRVVCMCNSG